MDKAKKKKKIVRTLSISESHFITATSEISPLIPVVLHDDESLAAD